MNSLDIMALAIIGVTLIQALTKGMAAELAELAFAFAGLLAALLFYETIEMVLLRLGVGNPMAAALSFILIFLLFIVFGALTSAKIKKEMGKRGLGWRDRFWGFPLGLVRGFLINSVLFLVLLVFPVNPHLVRTSATAPLFLAGSAIIIKVAPESFRKMVPGEDGDRLRRPSGTREETPGRDKNKKRAPDENRIEKV